MAPASSGRAPQRQRHDAAKPARPQPRRPGSCLPRSSSCYRARPTPLAWSGPAGGHGRRRGQPQASRIAGEFSQQIFGACRAGPCRSGVPGGFAAFGRGPGRFSWPGHEYPSRSDPGLLRQGLFTAITFTRRCWPTGQGVSGCTVHFADNEYDHGPIILAAAGARCSTTTRRRRLAARVFEQECEAYPEAIRLFAEGMLRIEGRRVREVGKPAS